MTEIKWKPLRLSSIREYHPELLSEEERARAIPGYWGLRLPEEEAARLAADELILAGVVGFLPRPRQRELV